MFPPRIGFRESAPSKGLTRSKQNELSSYDEGYLLAAAIIRIKERAQRSLSQPQTLEMAAQKHRWGILCCWHAPNINSSRSSCCPSAQYSVIAGTTTGNVPY